MNILVFSWRDPKHPLAGGAEQVMHEHMKGWIEKGHKVTLFSSRAKELKETESIDEVQVIRKGNQLLGVQLAAFLWYMFSKKEKYDLVVDQFHGIPFFTPLYVRVPKLAVVQEVAGKVWLKNDLPFPFNLIIGIVGFLIEPFIYFLFYGKVPFMVGSQSAKNDLVKIGIKQKNITLVPHGVIIKKAKKIFPKEKVKTVIYLGALAKDKGIEDAIKTFSLLNSKDKYNFWVVGKGGEEYVKYLKNLGQELWLKNNLVFWGFVSEEKKFELLQRAYLMINPSLLEGWGLVNIEANAMGIPVVAYTSQGLVDSVKHMQSGILVSQNTPEKLTQEIEAVFRNKKLYKKLSTGAKKWAQNFSWSNSKKLSLKLIHHV